MRRRSPTRALAWHEARQLARPVAAAVLLLAAAGMLVPGFVTHDTWIDLLLFGLAPGLAALMAATSVAGERAGGTLPFLYARPVSRSRVLGVKAAAAALACLVVAGLAWTMALLGHADWSSALDAPASRSWALSIVLVVSTAATAFGFSTALPDATTATVAGFAGGAALPVAATALLVTWTGDRDAAAATAGGLAVSLVAPSFALTWILARRHAERSLRPGRITAACLVAWVIAAVLTTPPALAPSRRAHAVRAGRALVVDGPLVAHPRSGAVAVLAAPAAGGPTRTVVAFLDRPSGAVPPLVLAEGTVPLSWRPRAGGLLVRWPSGTVRLVDHGGRTSAPHGPAGRSPSVVRPSGFAIRDGRLWRTGPAGPEPLFPVAVGDAS